jgi:hypothetical protein
VAAGIEDVVDGVGEGELVFGFDFEVTDDPFFVEALEGGGIGGGEEADEFWGGHKEIVVLAGLIRPITELAELIGFAYE